MVADDPRCPPPPKPSSRRPVVRDLDAAHAAAQRIGHLAAGLEALLKDRHVARTVPYSIRWMAAEIRADLELIDAGCRD